MSPAKLLIPLFFLGLPGISHEQTVMPLYADGIPNSNRLPMRSNQGMKETAS
jgi:hypothetical protein